MIGSTGVTVTALSPKGKVVIGARTWDAQSSGENIPEGTKVKVKSVILEGEILQVVAL